MKKIMFATLAASAFLCAVSSAQADDAQMRVKLAGLDVASDVGAKAALARIQFSAANFCDETSGRVSLERFAVRKRCVVEMTRRSVKQLNAPTVTALLDDRGLVEKPAQVAMAQ
jgi:UrcA family protein